MKRYHGTDSLSADNILKNINVSRGRGELGQGFYVGNLAHQAAIWAYKKGNQNHTGYSVICFEICDCDFAKLRRKYLTRKQAKDKRKELRRARTQCTYRFNVDAVVAPIVGRDIPHFMQIKFEGNNGESFINNTRKYELWKD